VKYILAALLLGVGAQAISSRSGAVPVSLNRAKALVLAAPNVLAAVRLRHAKPFFESIENTPLGWRFTVNSKTPCEGGVKACSNLLGHYSVDRRMGEVYDLDAAGGEGARVSSAKIQRLRRSF